jgi:plastocyanin
MCCSALRKEVLPTILIVLHSQTVFRPCFQNTGSGKQSRCLVSAWPRIAGTCGRELFPANLYASQGNAILCTLKAKVHCMPFIMAPILTLTFTALVATVVLAATTTSSGAQLLGNSIGKKDTSGILTDIQMHKSQSWNSTSSDGLHPTLTGHAGPSEAVTTGKHALPHPPWLSNGSLMAVQTASSGSTANSTTTVVVGKGGELVFSPSSLNATAGSIILFDFLGLNHNLTQSEFGNPCQGNGGFDSGFHQFNPTNDNGRFLVNYVVQDNTPRWFFCSQNAKRSHCQAGMVFSLNAHGRQAQYLDNALSAVTSAPTRADPA